MLGGMKGLVLATNGASRHAGSNNARGDAGGASNSPVEPYGSLRASWAPALLKARRLGAPVTSRGS
jgi:hypothetical protein